LEALRAWDGRWRLPAVLAHGDYCMTNVLFSDGPEQKVCAVLDWERARLNACSGFDALYFVVFSYAHWRKSTVMRVLCDLWRGACDAQLEHLLGIVRASLGLSTSDLRHIALAIWLRHLHQHASNMERWSAQRRHDWLDEPARCAREWLMSVPR
jgi:Ser/Thr protein kinase RdoA (MazF antagonist)